jgi:hypothetical protein
LLRQGYSMFSLKFFIWNFVTEDGSTINWASIRNEHEYNLLFRCRSSPREHNGGTWHGSTLVTSPGYYGRIFRKDVGWVWTRSSQNGFAKGRGPRNECSECFPIRMVSPLWIFCRKWIVSLLNISLIRYWSH